MASPFKNNISRNYSAIGATNPDNKTTDTTAAQKEEDARVKRIKAQDDRGRTDAAIAAEREWLKQVQEAPSSDSRKTNKIRLVSTTTADSTTGTVNTGKEAITFDLSPEISEAKQAIYAEIGDIRQAASLLIYGGSPSRKWSINAKFLSRTEEEADTTWRSVQLLRSWLNPDINYTFGDDAAFGVPHVLRFYGYGRTWQGIPVVVQSLNVDYPTDIDYIPTSYGTNVPVIQSVSFQICEARTSDDLLEKFDLQKFKRGVLPSW